MNLASALIKQILRLQDIDTWSNARKHYFPTEYQSLFSVIEKHVETYHELPTFEDLKFEIRDSATLEKLCAVESVDTDVDAYMLLQYLKNDYAQTEVLTSLEKYVERSVSFEDAEETVNHLHQIVMDVEEKVEIQRPEESMQRIELFTSPEELERFLPLGLNSDFDYQVVFGPRDYVLVGGQRGAGKSLTCANVINSVYEKGKSGIYFTIEMDSRSILQRVCAIATGVPYQRIKARNLSVVEWENVAKWWAARFENGEEYFNRYREHHDFDRLHRELSTGCQLLPTRQLDIIYEPSLTLARIRAELDKKMKGSMDVGIIVVDYLNQVKRSAYPSRNGQYDWAEQIEISKALKDMAQDYQAMVLSPYQIDKSGEARFAKGILDSADAAFTLNPWTKDDNCITFDCVKMRNGPEVGFTSKVDWGTLRIGPETALSPRDREGMEEGESSEPIYDV